MQGLWLWARLGLNHSERASADVEDLELLDPPWCVEGHLLPRAGAEKRLCDRALDRDLALRDRCLQPVNEGYLRDPAVPTVAIANPRSDADQVTTRPLLHLR